VFHRNCWFGSGQLPRLSVLFIITALVCSVLSLPITGRGEEHTAYATEGRQLEDLTKALVSLSSQYTKAEPAGRMLLLPQLQELASARFQQLIALAESDPKAVIRVALPDALRSIFPSELQEKIEASVTVEGTLEVFYEDSKAIEHEDEQLRYFLNVGNERLALSFVNKPAKRLQTGEFIRASGVRIAEVLIVESSASDIEQLGASLAAVTGNQRILVVLVQFSDTPVVPYSVEAARRVIFQDTNNFFLENSNNKVGLTGDVYGWYTIHNMNTTKCDPFGIRDAANAAAAAAGANVSSYSHFIYAFPENVCGFWGSGSIGGNPTYTWINGELSVKVVAHEFGHNLGLYHSHAWECGSHAAEGECSGLEYGDSFDVMGDTAALAHFNAFQKEQMGWLAPEGESYIDMVETSGTYLLSPYELPGGNAKALKVLKSVDPTTGKKTWYYVERRQAIGFDGWLTSYGNVQNGVLIHTGSESGGNSSYLLDMTPAATVWWLDWNDPALATGQSFTDPHAGLTIRTLWANSNGAAVSITLGSVAPETPICVRANPTISLSPTRSQWVSPGSKVSYTLQVTNTDSGNCPASTFALRADILKGWKMALGSPTLTIAPGNQVSTSLSVTSPSVIPDGFYPIEVEVTRQEGASAGITPVKASATYAITSELEVSLSPVQLSYASGQTTLTPVISAQVLFAEAPLANVKVTFSLLRPNGRMVRKIMTTGGDGIATAQFLLKGKDLRGAYQLTATGKQKKSLLGSAIATFTVQ
jgi:hypothetical protein